MSVIIEQYLENITVSVEAITNDIRVQVSIPTEGDSSTVVVDNLTTTSALAALSANQGVVLKAAINLNTAKETNIAHPLVETAVPVGALFTDTVYTHPTNHQPSIISQDSSNRFVTDIEKSTWNGKQANLGFTPADDTEVIKGIKESDGTNLVKDVNGVITLPDNSLYTTPTGTIGDGIADETTALNNWLNSGNNLYLPTGTYKISDELLSNTIRDNLTITGSPDAIIIATSNFNQAKSLIRLDNITNLFIDGLRIESNEDTATPVITTFGVDISNIEIQSCTNVTIQNCIFTKSVGAAIETKDITNLKILYNKALKASNYVFRIFGGSNVVIRGNTGTGQGEAQQANGTTVGQTPGIMATLVDHIIIDGNNLNDFKNTGTKTEGCNYVTYSNNTVTNSGKDGIKVQGYTAGVRTLKAKIIGNTVQYLRGYETDGAALISVQDCDEFIVQANIVSGGLTGYFLEIGISIHAGGGTYSKNGVVIGNVISNVRDHGIYLEDSSYVTVSDNNIMDYAIDNVNANGIYTFGTVNNCRLINNTITMNTRLETGFGYGISINGANHECDNNIIVNPNSGGITYSLTNSKIASITNNKITNPGEHGIRVSTETTASIDILNVDNNTINGSQGYFFFIFKNGLTIKLLTFRSNSLYQSSALDNRRIIEGFGDGLIDKLDITGTNTVGLFNADEYSLGSPAPTVIQMGKNMFRGTGTPESIITAPVGSRYIRTDGGVGTTFYVKETGTGNTGWAAK